MKKIAGLLLLFLFPFLGIAQTFSVDTTYKPIIKTTASITPPHEYFQLFNHTDDSLKMRWRISAADTYYPAQWSIAIQDNVTYHNPAPDSSDFILPPIAGTMDKIILNLFHNAFAGVGEVHIDLYTTEFASDTIRIVFDIRISQATAIEEQNPIQVIAYPNPSAGYYLMQFSQALTGDADFSVISIDGRQLLNGRVPSGTTTQEFNLDGVPSGVYLYRLLGDSFVYQVVCIKSE